MKKIIIITSLILSLLTVIPFLVLALEEHSAYTSAKECVGCHPIFLPTHKFYRPKNMKEDLPLDSRGKMTCITCHDCISGTCRLREPSGELCMVCHDCSKGMACLINVAHMGNSPNIETLVRDCSACHNAVLGELTEGPGNHKVNVMYIRDRRKGLATVTDRRVVLIDGKITCISCHNPYSSKAGRLVISNKGSRLCFSCHRGL